MIVALPRSGTTWAANWLTTDATLCLHDPLYRWHYRDWDRLKASDKSIGIACTGIWRWADWLNAHPARKVVLHRSLPEINQSLCDLGLPPCTPADVSALNSINGEHHDYLDLFDRTAAARIYERLLLDAFDPSRHAELVQIEMQPNFAGLSVGADVTRRLVAELQAATA